MAEKLFWIFEVEATGVVAANGDADNVWFYDEFEAWDRVKDAMDDLHVDDDGRCEWWGSMKRKAVTWAEIEEVFDDGCPSQSVFSELTEEEAAEVRSKSKAQTIYERFEELKQKYRTAGVPDSMLTDTPVTLPDFSLCCITCDAGMDVSSIYAAEERGWTDIVWDDGSTSNFVGICPDCRKKDSR